MKTSLIASAAMALTMTAPAMALPANFKAKADALLAGAYPAAGPGAAVIVTEDGKPVYEAGRGLADIAAKRAITPTTVFRIGSISKQFSAAIMLQLVDEGKLSLDDKLSKFLPDYPKPGADATVAQLLNHTVGVQSYTGIPGWMVEANTNRAYTTEQMIAQFKNLPSPSKPGEKFEYNNSGYVLVGAVIEKVTGKPWYQNVEERIARPLGLTTIRYGVLESETPNMAVGYTDAEGKVVPAQKIHMSVPHAAGALIGSVEDLAKWGAALHHGKIIPAALYAKMIAPTALPGGASEQYGYGIAPREVRGHKAIGHGGGIFGFSTDSIYLPKEDLFVAVFTNSDRPKTDPGMVMLKLAAMAANDPYPTFKKAALNGKTVAPWVGVYKLDNGERRLFTRGGKLFTQRNGGPEREVYAAGQGRFFYPDDLSWFEMKRDAAGKPVVAMYQEGAATPQLSTRSGPIRPEAKAAEVPRATLQSYVGTYTSPIGVLTIVLTPEGAITAQLSGQPPIPLKAISATVFATVGVDAQLTFQVAGGKVTGLVLNQGGRELPAKKD
ncbi:MAG: serine hydrolase domain-containing protein [Sphingomicrobium sp.]